MSLASVSIIHLKELRFLGLVQREPRLESFKKEEQRIQAQLDIKEMDQVAT